MRICTVHSYFAEAFRTLGHEVLALVPPASSLDSVEYDIAGALDAHNFVPDLLFQQEPLGPRTLLTGLDKVPGIRLFWAIDTHLNRVWHRCYARLFDGLCTPHRTRLAPHAAEFPPMLLLPIPGRTMAWTPHADRARTIGFVGRITEHRKPRNWLMEFLRSRYAAEIVDGLSVSDMFAFYAQTRLAPNEAICDEANFRLLEAASAGCLVLSHDAGPDQDALLEPGTEIVVYRHVLELREQLDWYAAHPDQAERLGRRAWERMTREHTLRHRAQAVLDFAATLPRRAVSATDSALALALSLSHMRRKNMVNTPLDVVRTRLEACPALPEPLAERLRLDAENSNTEATLRLAAIILDKNMHPVDMELNLAGSMAALHLRQWDTARLFWHRQQAAMPDRAPQRPESPFHLYMAWARGPAPGRDDAYAGDHCRHRAPTAAARVGLPERRSAVLPRRGGTLPPGRGHAWPSFRHRLSAHGLSGAAEPEPARRLARQP